MNKIRKEYIRGTLRVATNYGKIEREQKLEKLDI
jgi:hypothetical protein